MGKQSEQNQSAKQEFANPMTKQETKAKLIVADTQAKQKIFTSKHCVTNPKDKTDMK